MIFRFFLAKKPVISVQCQQIYRRCVNFVDMLTVPSLLSPLILQVSGRRQCHCTVCSGSRRWNTRMFHIISEHNQNCMWLHRFLPDAHRLCRSTCKRVGFRGFTPGKPLEMSPKWHFYVLLPHKLEVSGRGAQAGKAV